MTNNVKTYYCTKNDIDLFTNKGRRKFTLQEDENLKVIINKIGTYDWEKISQLMPGRSAKQCRDRFCNYLNAMHSNEPWDNEEDQVLLRLLSIVGTKWTKIAQHLPKRSGNDVKNRWYKHLSKIYYRSMNSIIVNSNISDNNNSIEPPEKQNEDKNLSHHCKYLSISSLLI